MTQLTKHLGKAANVLVNPSISRGRRSSSGSCRRRHEVFFLLFVGEAKKKLKKNLSKKKLLQFKSCVCVFVCFVLKKLFWRVQVFFFSLSLSLFFLLFQFSQAQTRQIKKKISVQNQTLSTKVTKSIEFLSLLFDSGFENCSFSFHLDPVKPFKVRDFLKSTQKIHRPVVI